MKNHPITRLCIVLILSICAATALAHTWTDSTGKHKIEGKFVKLADGTVEIRRDDGQTVRIALEKLSDVDQAFVRHVAKPIAKEMPSVAAAPDERPAPTAKPAAASGDAKDTQPVFAEGVGTTKEEALKDAFRAAVRQVVGEAVDAETIVKNEELVRDQVLTYSDGFIPQHKVTSEKRDNGLFRVGILATVQRRSVIMKLKAADVTIKKVDGQSLYGSIVTQVAAEKDAAALMAKALEGFPDNYMEAHAVGEPKVLKRTDSEATLLINVEFTPSMVAYKAFAARVCKNLEQSCKLKGEFTTLIPEVAGETHGPWVRENHHAQPGQLLDRELAKWMPGLLKPDWKRDLFWTCDGVVLAVANLVSKDSSRVNWSYYVLDATVGDAVVCAATREATCTVSLIDADGKPVSVDRFDPRNDLIPGLGDDQDGRRNQWRCFLCTVRGDVLTMDHSETKLAFVAPLLFGSSRSLEYVPKLTIPRKAKLSLDELRKVASVKCELTFRAGSDDKNFFRRRGKGGKK